MLKLFIASSNKIILYETDRFLADKSWLEVQKLRSLGWTFEILEPVPQNLQKYLQYEMSLKVKSCQIFSVKH